MGQMGLVAVAADLVAGTCQEVVGAKKKVPMYNEVKRR